MVVEGVGLVLLSYSKMFIDLISTANFIFGRMFGRKFPLCVPPGCPETATAGVNVSVVVKLFIFRNCFSLEDMNGQITATN